MKGQVFTILLTAISLPIVCADDLFEAVFSGGASSGQKEEKEIPLGVEAVTGLRSNYFYRGFDLADTVLDFQVETEVAIKEDWFLNVGGWYASEGGGDFRQASIFAGVTREWDELSLTLLATYHDFDGSVFDSGFDLGVEGRWYATEQLDVKAGVYRDLAASAWYAKVETGYYQKIDDDSYVVLNGGLSLVDDYYGRDGLNDFFGRVSYTRNLNDHVSVTPFVGVSIAADGSDPLTDDVFEGGIWFEVSF